MPDQRLTDMAAAAALDGTELAYTVQAGQDRQATTAQFRSFIGRTKLTAASTNYYVSATGSDVVGTGTVGNPWLTLQNAINVISETIDFCGQQLVLNIGIGTFVGFGMRAMVGGGNLLLFGSGHNVTIITNNVPDNIYSFGDCFDHNVTTDTIISFDGLEFLTNTTAGCVVIASAGVIVCMGDFLTFQHGRVNFSASVNGATLVGMFGPSLLFWTAGTGLQESQWNIYMTGNVATSCSHFMQIENGAQVQMNGSLQFATNPPAGLPINFSTAFITVGGFSSVFAFVVWVNPLDATGTQAHIFGNSFYDNNGQPFSVIPGTPNTLLIENNGTILGQSGAHPDFSYTSDDLLTYSPHIFSDTPTPVGRAQSLVHITDAAVNYPGWIVSQGGGAFDVLAQSDGTNWRVLSHPNTARQILNAATTLFVSNASGTLAGGALYTAGYYDNVPLVSVTGTGAGATAVIKVSGGAVVQCSPYPNIRASTYAVGDILSAAAANIGGTGAGFTFTITAIGTDTITFGVTGIAALTPFATPQAAYDFTAQYFDLCGAAVTIQMADGVYGGINLDTDSSFAATDGHIGLGQIIFQGNAGNVDGAIIDGNANNHFAVFDCFTQVQPTIILQNLQLRNKAGGSMINVNGGSSPARLDMSWAGNLHFRFRGTGTVSVAFDSYETRLLNFATVTLDYTDAGAAAQRSFYDLDSGAFVHSGGTMTVTGSPNWSDAFVKIALGGNFEWDTVANFAGATGTRAWVGAGGLINTFTAGVASIPGNSAGFFLDGGQWQDGSPNKAYIGQNFSQITAVPFAGLPTATTYEGMIARINNCSTTVVGNNADGAGANHVMVLSDGTNWRVMTAF